MSNRIVQFTIYKNDGSIDKKKIGPRWKIVECRVWRKSRQVDSNGMPEMYKRIQNSLHLKSEFRIAQNPNQTLYNAECSAKHILIK